MPRTNTWVAFEKKMKAARDRAVRVSPYGWWVGGSTPGATPTKSSVFLCFQVKIFTKPSVFLGQNFPSVPQTRKDFFLHTAVVGWGVKPPPPPGWVRPPTRPCRVGMGAPRKRICSLS